MGDHKHLTFFEMLGNFSVGDYFKQGAIEFAWEFVTKHLELPPEKLFLTVYTDDDEAEALWLETSGAPPERMYRYGKSDNWWGPPGAEGPCGPCSELHYDFGEALGCAPLSSPAEVAAWIAAGMKPEEQPGCHPNCDRCERFVEFWNLVFMQFYQDMEGALSPLPKPNVDTGMGLERIAIIKQGASNIFDTDLYQPIIGKVGELAGSATARRSRRTCRCASWPSTPAARRSSSATASSPATRGAATCCGGSFDAPSGSGASSA